MMQKRKIYVLAGLLFCSVSAFAQSGKKSITVDRKNQVALPVGPVLPGEENLSAKERAERDFLMPTRRKKAAALTTAKVEEAQQAAIDATAHSLETAEATVAAEEAAAPAVKTAPRTYHRTYHRRTSSSKRRTSSHTTKRKTTSKSSTSKSKRVVKKPTSTRRRR